MKLKSIHISGFKSFADRVFLQYHHGITGIVGPNGSGKSNVIDAVRWVMGEQTNKNLRADDPTDIIFAGSQTRKALSLAEVTLVFANDGLHCPPEYLHLSEISIGRRINRGAEREYLLNREPCRLRDIVDFLLSVGLGSKSYAIIQQDRRDRIIQASPEDLREILEETAGITIFKTRRKEAEKRLESTSEKMKSLGEIETELARQKASLEEQVRVALKKRQYMQELKEKEQTLLEKHIGFYSEMCQKTRAEIEQRTQEIQLSAVESGSLEVRANEIASLRLELAQQIKSGEHALDDTRIFLAKYQERQEHHLRQKNDQDVQEQRLADLLAEEQKNLQREEEKLDFFLAELGTAEKESVRFEQEQEALRERLEEAEEFLQVERAKGEGLRIESRAIQASCQVLQAKMEDLLAAIEKSVKKAEKTSEQQREERTRYNDILQEKQIVLSQLEKSSAGLDEAVTSRAALEQKLKEKEQVLLAAEEERNFFKQKQLEISAQVSSLKKMLDANSGLSDGVLFLKKNLESKIAGFLFDLVVLHKEDEAVLEANLPSLFQAALVENTDALIDIFDRIEESSVRCCSFFVKDFLLPLSELESQGKTAVCGLNGARSVGDRLERCDFPPLLNLFARVFICRDEWQMLQAQRLSAGCPGFLFVSERGVVFRGHSGEFLCGLQADGEVAAGVLQLRRSYGDVLQEEQSLHVQLARAEGALYTLNAEKKQVEEQLRGLSGQLEQEKLENLKISAQLGKHDIELKHIDATLQRLAAEKTGLDHDLQDSKQSFAKALEQSERLEEELKALDLQLRRFEESHAEKKEESLEIAEALSRKKSDSAVCVERLNNARRQYEETTFQLKRLQQKTLSLMQQRETLAEQKTLAGVEFDRLAGEIENLHKQIALHETTLEQLVDKESQANEELRLVERQLREQKDFTQTKQKFIHEKSIDLARYETVLQTALQDAKDRFGLHPQDLPQTPDITNQGLEHLEESIKTLTKAIADIGPVNEQAIDEFREVSDRLDFLMTQKADILRSVEELYASIQEIERATKTRFHEIFERVHLEFQKIFPVLFPGGQGELHLLNPEDLLTTGVEIRVRLPGKKMQNMSLFSGGEKALVAISLIFSLLKTTPVPFCFLDEVDAPLDEANVGRFNDLLEALSDEFQFVVITHNRRTMEVLDTIYGISMSEPGVSQIVSVDLTDVPTHLRKKQKSAVSRSS